MSPTYSDMVYHLGGVPVNSELPFISGNVYFVCSSGGNDGTNRGVTVDEPFASIDYALAQSTLNDCIILLPGHAETLSATGIFDIDKEGVTIWGLGHYDRRPTFTITATAGGLECNAADIHVHNVKLVAGIKNIDQGVDINAKGVKLTNVWMEEVSASSYSFDYFVGTDATANNADGFWIEGCDFLCAATHGLSTGGIVLNAVQNDFKILNNRFMGWWTTGAVGPISCASTAPMYNFRIEGNMIVNAQSTAAGNPGITLEADNAIGIVANNYVLQRHDTTAGISVPTTGAVLVAENYVTGAPNESAKLHPDAYSSA